MLSLQRGQKLPLSQLNVETEFQIEIQLSAPFNLDLSCFGLDAQQKLIDEAYMVFYNQPQNPDGSVSWHNHPQQFSFKLQHTNLHKAERFMICAAIDDAHATMAGLISGHIRIQNPQGQTVAQYMLEPKVFAQEKAVMLVEVYLKTVWRLSVVAQGFNGGLAALVEHFGGEVAAETPVASPVPPPPATPTPTPTLSLSKIQLDKTGQSHRISLDKNNAEYLKIEAIWVDNGDANANNDDLDLRIGFLPLHQKDMDYVWCPSKQGSLQNHPYIQHQGDVTQASANEPGKEVVLVHPDIAKKMGGKVALVFSVYSAVSNGAVSIASLQPKMRMQYGQQIVECVFNAQVSVKAKSRFVYTYVIGVAIIDENGISLQHSGLTSDRFSEKTPRIIWQANGENVSIKVDGPPMFK